MYCNLCSRILRRLVFPVPAPPGTIPHPAANYAAQIYSKEFSIEMSLVSPAPQYLTRLWHWTLMQIFFAEFDISFSSKEPVLALLHTNSDLMHLFAPKYLVRFPNCHECQYSSSKWVEAPCLHLNILQGIYIHSTVIFLATSGKYSWVVLSWYSEKCSLQDPNIMHWWYHISGDQWHIFTILVQIISIPIFWGVVYILIFCNGFMHCTGTGNQWHILNIVWYWFKFSIPIFWGVV